MSWSRSKCGLLLLVSVSTGLSVGVSEEVTGGALLPLTTGGGEGDPLVVGEGG